MWTVVKLSDGKWSVRCDGKELYILSYEGRATAASIERMLNQIATPKEKHQ